MIIDEMQAYYRKRAPEYDASMGYDDPEQVALLKPVILMLQAILEGLSVLELACGPCFWTQYVAEIASLVKATDFNQSTLDQAKQKSLPWQRVVLERADAYDLEAIEGDFQAVYAVDWFSHIPLEKIPAFLKQLMSRVPVGSPIVFVDQLPGPNSLTGLFDEQGNHIQERVVADNSRYRVVKNFFADTEVQGLFSAFEGELAITRFPECRRVMYRFTNLMS